MLVPSSAASRILVFHFQNASVNFISFLFDVHDACVMKSLYAEWSGKVCASSFFVRQ